MGSEMCIRDRVKHLEMVKLAPHPELGELNLVRTPINLSAFPRGVPLTRAAPDPGEHTHSLLKGFGFSEAEVTALESSGAI